MRCARPVSISLVMLILLCDLHYSLGLALSQFALTKAPQIGAVSSCGLISTDASIGRRAEIPYTKEKSLSFDGYRVNIERRRVSVENLRPENEVAVLTRHGRTIRVFDAVRHPLGAFVRLALAPVLGNGHNQLIIEQTGPREWVYWVIALEPRFHVLFYSAQYPVGHELNLEDVDGDGSAELLMTLHTFWFFDNLCGACSPWITIAFKYDGGSFRPANHLLKQFQQTTDNLTQSESEIKVWQSQNPEYISDPQKASELYSKVLNRLILLIYSGKESAGWSFFNRVYNLPDKAVRESMIKRALRRDRVYRIIRRDLAQRTRKTSLH